MSDSVKEGSFPSNVLYESPADGLVLRVDRSSIVVLAAVEWVLVERITFKVRRIGLNKGKQAPTTPKHNCAWAQVVDPMSLYVTSPLGK